jgi:hypothetical protein
MHQLLSDSEQKQQNVRINRKILVDFHMQSTLNIV